MRETPKAAHAFYEYCLLGSGRSLPKLAQKFGESTANVRSLQRLYERWSSAHHWQDRVRAYDRQQAEERRKAHDAAIEAMNERHIAIALREQRHALEQIEKLIDAKAFGSLAAIQLLKFATDLERLARGEPTVHVEQSGSAHPAIAIYLPQKQSMPS